MRAPTGWAGRRGPRVLEIARPTAFRSRPRTCAGRVAPPPPARRVVAIDLREDWPAALRRAGFDARQPAAWIAEGLLAYLPPDARDRLLDNITALSTEGSPFAADNVPNFPRTVPDQV